MAQLMPLPLTVSCFSKIQIGVTFLVPAHPGSPRKRAVKRVCVCTHQCSKLKPLAVPGREFSLDVVDTVLVCDKTHRQMHRDTGP